MQKDKGVLKPRAYARLLKMIGDQLIKNEKIALIELIKNSYDADANWVQIRFENFERSNDGLLAHTDKSSIEIEDDGSGMSFETIQNVWLNPATPNKLLEKQKGKNITKRKKRIIQGEKGIGRFAVYKLGSVVELSTKLSGSKEDEILLINDLSVFDNEIISDIGKSDSPKFLDQVEYLYEINPKDRIVVERKVQINNKIITRPSHGTLIKITKLQGEWSMEKINDILADVSKLSSPLELTEPTDFVCDFVVNGETQTDETIDVKSQLEILQEKAPIKVKNGKYDGKDKIAFELNGGEVEIYLERLLGNTEFRKRFEAKGSRTLRRLPECGPFNFQFHIYDFTNQARPKYKLLTDEKAIIKRNRIYLYRDGLRVFPYGDKSDDWLEVDILRGTGRAGDYLSNDQTVGFIAITTQYNPNLKDKTNREGLLEIGNAFADFKVLIQAILGVLHGEFQKYRLKEASKNKIALAKESITKDQFENFRNYLHDKKDLRALKAFDVIHKNYQNERAYLKERAEITEDLAGVGITVEAASHDLMMMIQRANSTLNLLVSMTKSSNFDRKKLHEQIKKLKGQIQFIESQIEGIQPIFRSSKRQAREFILVEIIDTVKLYFESALEQEGVEISIEEKGKGFSVHCSEAVLLQVFVNLVDNAIYWLKTTDRSKKRIQISIDKSKRIVVFSDNGPGISEEDQNYIFEPFFSAKGIQGRGLGLYIARQLLQRFDFEINYVNKQKDKILSGANFLIDFNPQ